MTKESIYKTAIEVVIDGISNNPSVAPEAIKHFLQEVLDQNI